MAQRSLHAKQTSRSKPLGFIRGARMAPDQVRDANELVQRVQRAGLIKFNFSDVVRIAMCVLEEQFKGKNDVELIEYITRHWEGSIARTSG